jgi:hypothetical protein
MSSNWLLYTLSTTPKLITEGVTHVDTLRLQEFYDRVQKEMLYGATQSGGSLPFALQEQIAGSDAENMTDILEETIQNGDVMDSGWIEDYWRICERMSGDMHGYPKSCLGQWRELREAYAGQQRAKPAPKPATVRNGTDEAQAFRFLDLPEKIKSMIYTHLIPCKSFTISDWAFGSEPSVCIRRMAYVIKDWNEENRTTTYIVLSSAKAHLNLMLANRTLYHEVVNHLSECRFDFRGSAAGTRAFLHDNLQLLSKMKRISLRYTTTTKTQKFMGCTSGKTVRAPLALKTNFDQWRNLIKVLRHSATQLEDIELTINKYFWDNAPWTKGVRAVLSATALCKPSKGKVAVVKNFLSEIAKLSAVNLRLTIEHPEGSETKDSEAKEKFRRELQEKMCELMLRNPYEEKKVARCVCRKRLLDESCFREDS